MTGNIKTINAFNDNYIIVEYELFTMCDKECSYCYNINEETPKRFTNNIKDIIDGLSRIMDMDNKRIIIQLIGGEVLLHKDFDMIIQYFIDNKHPYHKLSVFTHGDHYPTMFKSKLSPLISLGDDVKINISLHQERLNKEQFKNNLIFVEQEFNHCALFIFVYPEYINNFPFLYELLDSTTIKIFPIILDDSKDIKLAHQLVNFNKLEKYEHRMDILYDIDGSIMPYNRGKYYMYKSEQLRYGGRECTVRAFELTKEGDITMCCFSSGSDTLGNIFDKDYKHLFDERKIICQQDKCHLNLVSMKVEK